MGRIVNQMMLIIGNLVPCTMQIFCIVKQTCNIKHRATETAHICQQNSVLHYQNTGGGAVVKWLVWLTCCGGGMAKLDDAGSNPLHEDGQFRTHITDRQNSQIMHL